MLTGNKVHSYTSSYCYIYLCQALYLPTSLKTGMYTKVGNNDEMCCIKYNSRRILELGTSWLIIVAFKNICSCLCDEIEVT